MLVRLSAVLLALLAGAMLVDAVALVPFWQSLPPTGVNEWFGRHAWRIDWLTGALVVLAALASAGGLVRAWHQQERRARMALACISVLAVGAIGGFFHWPTARLLATPEGVPPARVEAVLWQWSAWEWLRVLLAAVGCGAAISATEHPRSPATRPGSRRARRKKTSRLNRTRPTADSPDR